MSRSERAAEITATGWRVNAVNAADVREVTRDGREYLQFPLISVTEMVLDYPEERGTSEYLPAEHIAETAELWDGTLLTSVHPENRYRTVRDPESFMGDVIGAVHDPELLDGGARVKVSGLIDVEKANALGGHAARLVDLLRRGEEVSVSAGYATMDDREERGTFDGEPYQLVQGPPLPDHVAIFPSDTEFLARCTPEDGCVAPKANTTHRQRDGQRDNQQSVQDARTNMSETFPNGEREKAIATILNEAPGVGPDIADNPDSDLLVLAQGFGYELPGCDCGGDSCECGRTNATASKRANYGAVPGQVARNYDETGRDREDPEEYPAGGRKAWERRQCGLDEIPDEQEVPAGGRSDYERRQRQAATANATDDGGESSDGGDVPTGTRSSYERRNGDDEDLKPYLAEEYPYTAKRAQEEREQKQERREEIRQRALRNQNLSDGA